MFARFTLFRFFLASLCRTDPCSYSHFCWQDMLCTIQ